MEEVEFRVRNLVHKPGCSFFLQWQEMGEGHCLFVMVGDEKWEALAAAVAKPS